AAKGLKVVIVDANLHNPNIAGALGVTPRAFLDAVLEHGRKAETLVTFAPTSGIDFIAGRTDCPAAASLFHSAQFQELIARLKIHYDLVLIDTPDLARSAQGLEIAAAADSALFVARADATRIDAAISAVENLAACERKPEGAILNRARSRRARAERVSAAPARPPAPNPEPAQKSRPFHQPIRI